MKPILLDLPEEFESERLTIRVPRPGEGTLVQAAYVEAGDHIYKQLPQNSPTSGSECTDFCYTLLHVATRCSLLRAYF